MGEYFAWVNVDKREYLAPCDFGLGNKLFESTVANNALLGALCALMDTDWRGDRLIWLGDYAELPISTENPAIKCLAQQFASSVEAGSGYGGVFEYVKETYRNVSALFREAEAQVRPEIEWMLANDDFSGNEYRVDPADPWQGLFGRSVKYRRYAVNHSGREYVDQLYARSGLMDDGEGDTLICPFCLRMARPWMSRMPGFGSGIGWSSAMSAGGGV